MILAIFVALLLPTIFADPEWVSESEVLRTYPARDFVEIWKALDASVGRTLSYTSGLKGLDLFEDSFSPINISQKLAQKMTFTPNSVRFLYDSSSFYIDIHFLYVYSVDLMPVSGKCTLRLRAGYGTYYLTIERGKNIVPILSTQWSIELISNSNGLANAMGFEKFVQEAATHVIIPRYSSTISKILLSSIKTFYAGYYGHMNTYIVYPYLRNSSIQVVNDFDHLELRKDALVVYYDQAVGPLRSVLGHEEVRLLRTVHIHYHLFASILKSAMKMMGSIRITDKDINARSAFRLDAKELLVIFPDIIMQRGSDCKVSLEFHANPAEIGYLHNSLDNTITFQDLIFSFRIYLDDEEYSVLNSTIILTGTFKPALFADPTDPSIAVLNLKASRLSGKVIHSRGSLSPEALFNEAGVQIFVNSALSNFVMKYVNAMALGNGLKLAAGASFSTEKSTVQVDDDGVAVALFSL